MDILVVDDETSVCECVAEKIEREVASSSYGPFTVVPLFRLSDIGDYFRNPPYPRLVILDLDLGVTRGIATLECFRDIVSRAVPQDSKVDTTVAIFSGTDFLSPTSFEILQRAVGEFGVRGIIPKNGKIARMLVGLERLLAGEDFVPIELVRLLASPSSPSEKCSKAPNGLTPREYEIAELVAEGLEDKVVAKRLGLQPGTVRQNVSRILQKFSVDNRTQLAREFMAQRTGNSSL
ncbi:two-component system nitrate/nitrite response regulator NarL [Paraburkholderia sp. GAS448]|uniref:helix-turn-helix transcriptional regulator n=1 Tax=Paraburkholderia sp. GAS448 TaxID=3035136 RepID=UPI003D213E91